MVLQTLDVLGPLHGYGIARRIEQISGDQLAVNQGTLYPRAVEVGLLAAMLVVTGIFGVGVYTVRRRTRELGIRLALGARKAQVMRAAVARPMVLLGAGSFLGLLAAILASHLLGHIVYQANPRDPVVVGGAVLMMVLLGIAASAIPAGRALAVDPSELPREQ